MLCYRLAGQDFSFQHSMPGLERFRKDKKTTHLELSSFHVDEWTNALHAGCWIDGHSSDVLVEQTRNAVVFRVNGVGEFFISFHDNLIGKLGIIDELTAPESEVLAGMVLVQALALRGVWSLHASAGLWNGQVVALVAESGTGKSTLAAYLSRQAGWSLVADDILPVTCNENGLTAWPHFPQLKLPVDAQPGLNLPEQLPLNVLCELVPVDADVAPRIKRLSPEQAVMVLLGHTAGSRLFDAKMLEAHLAFCAQAAEYVPVYQLSYPHSMDALPRIKELLESVC